MIPVAADFDVTNMELAVKNIDAEKVGKELDLKDLDPGNIEMDLKWWQFKEAFLNMAKNIMGVNNKPLYSVISSDQPVGWVPSNASGQRVYQLPHTGDVYNRYNKWYEERSSRYL